MSANNQLVIYKKKNGRYRIKQVDVDTASGFDIDDDIERLEKAVKVANAYMQENEVKYGLKIISEWKKQ